MEKKIIIIPREKNLWEKISRREMWWEKDKQVIKHLQETGEIPGKILSYNIERKLVGGRGYAIPTITVRVTYDPNE